MRLKIFFISIYILFGVNSVAQKMTLSDLTNLSSKKNWEDVNQSLISKGWTFYDSEKGSSSEYSTITWSFNKDRFSDKSQGWFYLYTYEGLPNKISYSFFNKEIYSSFQNSISSSGFKLVKSDIEDNEVISTYQNSKYTLSISTSKRKDDDWSDISLTAYNLTLINKEGIYDADNGKKINYYPNGQYELEYTLLNGELNGPFTYYNLNGKTQKIGNYLNGVENGLFKEFDEKGNLEVEYTMSNGKKTGNFIVYENGNISYSNYYNNDLKNGPSTNYYYNADNGQIRGKLIGDFVDDEKNGTWKLIVFEDGIERLLAFENFSNGILNGTFQKTEGDSLIVGSYKEAKLHGEYKIYLDVSRSFLGGLIETDISKLTLIVEGYFKEGVKSGNWKNYDLTGSLINEGGYLNSEKHGEWNYFYPNYIEMDGSVSPYSKQLYLIQNFSNGKLSGKSTRYSYLSEEEIPCLDKKDNKSDQDICKTLVYQNVFETSFYKDNKLWGDFELLDSMKNIISKGTYENDLKEGQWIHRYVYENLNNEIEYYFQKGNYSKDKREGKWIEYHQEGLIEEIFSFQNDELHGETISLNQYNRPSEKKQFNSGKLKEIILFDSLGLTQIKKYEIFEENIESYRCRKTDYSKDKSISQEYWVKKDKEIDHYWFDFTFYLALRKKDNGESNGYKDGEFIVLNSGNQPEVSGKYFKEDRVGLWTFFYYDQNVKIVSNYNNDVQVDEKYFKFDGELYSGEFTLSDNEKDILEIRKIKDGLRNGKTVFIDTNSNKTVKKETYKNGKII